LEDESNLISSGGTPTVFWRMDKRSNGGNKHKPFISFIFFPKTTRGLEPISYRGVLMSTILYTIVYVFLQNLLNVQRIHKRMIRFQKLIKISRPTREQNTLSAAGTVQVSHALQ
jgi:hypothetical protein